MSWDTPESGVPDHYFLELTNINTEQVWAWNNLSGNSNSKTNTTCPMDNTIGELEVLVVQTAPHGQHHLAVISTTLWVIINSK